MKPAVKGSSVFVDICVLPGE